MQRELNNIELDKRIILQHISYCFEPYIDTDKQSRECLLVETITTWQNDTQNTNNQNTSDAILTVRSNRKFKSQYLRAAISGVNPFRFPDALKVWRHVVQTGVDVEHEEEIADGPDHSGGKNISSFQRLLFSLVFLHDFLSEFTPKVISYHFLDNAEQLF